MSFDKDKNLHAISEMTEGSNTVVISAIREIPNDIQELTETNLDGPEDVRPSGEITEDQNDLENEDEREKLKDSILSKIVSFRPFSPESFNKQVEREKAEREKAIEKQAKAQEAHLVDGELIFGDEEDDESAALKPDPGLVEGNVLLDNYGVFPTDYMGKPLEEIDKAIIDKTFVVIAKRFNKKYIYRFSSTSAFFLLPPWNLLRKCAVRIATNQFFDYLVILTIIANCVFLTMPDLAITETLEYIFLAIYVIEMLIKVTARGFIMNNYTYLRDGWNWLDFIVIVLAFITIIIQYTNPNISLGNLQVLRTFRVLRALKTVSIVPGLKTIVNALLRAFRMLIDVVMLTFFCLMVFALFGLQVYQGVLRHKCVAVLQYDGNITSADNYSELYNNHITNKDNWFGEINNYELCGNSSGAGSCPANYTCLPDIGDNPNFGYTNYDNFGWAILNAFQLITLDFWEDNYDKVIKASGPWNVLFFILVVFFGSFYLINLMLAVVALSYEEEAESAGKEREREKASEKKKKPNPIYDLAIISVANKRRKHGHKSGSENDRLKQRRGSHWPKLPTNSKSPRKPINPNKPLVKKPSKDSGFSENMKSSRAHAGKGLKHQDSRQSLRQEDSDIVSSSTNSSSEGMAKKMEARRKMLIKQDSAGNVSTSSVILERQSTLGEGSMISESSQDTSYYIIKPDEMDDADEMSYNGQLVDRNCNACGSCCRCFVPWVRIQNAIYKVVSDPLFDLSITLCILMNTIIMATEHFGMSDATRETIQYANYVFTGVFTLECVLKISVLTKYYFHSGWNIFDFVIVLASLVDVGLEDIDGVSAFRTFRLLRVFRLAQSWPTMRILISIIVNTFGALGNLTVVLFIIIYIFAVTGLQLFNKGYTETAFAPDPVPRWNFSTFFHACMMIFRVLCGEWIEPLYDCMRAESELCMLVFFPALVLGNFMVLNLFLALLLNAFATDSLNKHKESNKDEVSRFKLAFYRIKHLCCCCIPDRNNAVKPNDERGDDQPDTAREDRRRSSTLAISNGDIKPIKEEPDKLSNGDIPSNPDISTKFETTEKRNKFADFGKALNGVKKETDADKEINDSKKDVDIELGEIDSPKDVDGLELGDTAADVKDDDEEPIVIEKCLPLCCTKRLSCTKSFEPTTPFGRRWYKMREISSRVVDNKIFEYGVLFVIFASSITLAFEDIYLDENVELSLALYYLNVIFCVIFSVEMLFKWFAYGLRKYFTSFWTILDFTIVLISIASLIAESLGISNITAFRSLRTLRALRPLRAVSRLQSMRIVVNALMMAIPAIFNVFIVCMVFWLIFSIMGVQFFAGRFYKCLDENGERFPETVIPNKTECLRQNYTWKNSNINFDNVLQGYLALFQVATFEGWMEIMIDAIDSTEVDQQPKTENNIYYYLYFVAFIIFGSFFTLNLIIGVIIDNFNVLKKRYDGSYLDMFLTPSQRNYYNTLKKLGNKKPQKTIKRPKTKFQAFFFDIATSSKFELSIILIIFLNMITLAIESYKQSQYKSDILEILNLIFTAIFTVECVIKLVGMRWHYFRQFWNVFDFIIVLLSLLGLILDDVLAGVFVTPTLLRVGRVFRIGRVLRLIKAAKGLRKLLFALIISLPAIVNIGALLFLLMYIYAIIGMSSFKNLKVTPSMNSDTVNFQTFANSIILLFRLSTSAGWNEILDPLLIEPPFCDPNYITLRNGTKVSEVYGDCGIPWLAIPFMVTYIFIAYLVIINMYIAVILENFNQAHEQEEVGITEDDFDMFYSVWERYDPLATQFIKYDFLSDFLADLEEPLGIPKPNEIAIVSFNLPIVEGDKLHCLDILMALVKKHLGSVDETEESRTLHKNMELKFGNIFPSRVMTVKKSTTMQRKKEDVAARTLQRCWRSFKTQKALKNITSLAMQQKTDLANQTSRSRANSIISLGRRLSNALNTFFNSSRPSSALSRVSLKSNMSHHSLQPISRKSNISNTLKVPSINTLYSPGTTGETQDLYL